MKTYSCIYTITLAILAALFAFKSNAQDARIMQFQSQYEKYHSQYREIKSSGRYSDAIVPLKDLVTLFDTTTIYKDAKFHIPEGAIVMQKSMFQYDLACCYALTGQKKQALAVLGESVANGYNDYNNMVRDNDFESLRGDKKFMSLLATVKGRMPIEVLKRSNSFKEESNAQIPAFKYQSKEDTSLEYLREYFQLDTIAGRDNELEYIKNILHFAHDNIRHDGGNRATVEFDAIDLYNYTKATGKGVNCRQLAISLAGMYLAQGIKARVVTCLPADPNDYECHVINAVYSETLGKWLYIDPTMDAWVMDENGTMLSIMEVRERLIDGRELVLCETANWNHENIQTKENYLDNYMAKNLYYFVCKEISCFNPESVYRNVDNEDIRLIPEGFVNDNFKCPTTTDPAAFWARPE